MINYFKGIVFSLDLGEAIYIYDILSCDKYIIQAVELQEDEFER